MGGLVPPGVSAFNWLRAQQLRQVTQTSGLQLRTLKASDPSAICGRQIDSSVAVGGAGNIPITPDYITPDLIQGNAFPAPTYVDAADHGNLLTNPSAVSGLTGWSAVEAATPNATAFFTDQPAGQPYPSFVIGCTGGSRIDSLLTQQFSGLTPGATMTLSGYVQVRYMGPNGTSSGNGEMVGTDILGLDASGSGLGINIGYGTAVIAADYNHTAVAPLTPFSYSFTVPASGNIIVRLHVRDASAGNTGSTDAVTGAFTQLKLEYGSVATSYLLQSFQATTQVDIAGVMHSINVAATFTNIPLNAVSILWCFRNTNSSVWTPWAETSVPGTPYPNPQQLLTFSYGQLAMGVHYDFGAAYVDLAGNVGAISAFASNFNPNTAVFQINSSYMKSFGGTFTPAFLSQPQFSTPMSVNGITSSVRMDFTLSNQPTDGSLSRVSLWFRVTPPGGPTTAEGNDHKYSFYGSVPAVGVGNPLSSLSAHGTYSFTFADLINTTSYDFAIGCEDASGGETALVYASSATAQALVLPAQSLPTAPTNAYINAQGTSIQTGPTGQGSYYSQVTMSIAVTNGPGGAAIDPSAWLAQIVFLAKAITADKLAYGDQDFFANDYVNCKTVYTNTIGNPLVVTIGPFPAGTDQEIAIQLVDQAGKVSNADPFLTISPPTGPVFDSQGRLQYQSFGTAIQQVVTPSGTLATGSVGRAQIASPETGQNLLFNPNGFFGTKFWSISYGTGGESGFSTDTYAGGRFRMSSAGGFATDWVRCQQLANLLPGYPMVMSGLVEIEVLPTLGFVGVDVFDPTTNTVLGSRFFYGFQSATYFEFKFTIPASGIVQVRMHVNNNNTTSNYDSYFYKLQLEHGTTASPFNDAMGAAAAANVTSPDGKLVVVNNNVSGGTIDYFSLPTNLTNTINTSGQYNAANTIPGSTVPYASTPGAYQVAIGTNGQLTTYNQYLFASIGISGQGNPATHALTTELFVPLGEYGASVPGHTLDVTPGIWLITVIWTVSGVSFQPRINIVGTTYPTTALPNGFSNNINMNTFGPAITGNNSISASCTVTGDQSIGIFGDAYFTSTSSSSNPGTMFITMSKGS